MTSTRQKEANGRNAVLSTGPVTPAGKAVVSKNAVKHGIFANDLVINNGDGRENELEYHALFDDLQKDLAPVGRMEKMLVEKIAINYWRLRRLIRYETGEIRGRLDDFKESAIDILLNNDFYSQPKLPLEYYNYDDDISDAEYRAQLRRVALFNRSDLDLGNESAALEFVLRYRLDREDVEFREKDYVEAREYVTGLSPQMRGKLRKELQREAKQILDEMKTVRNWQVNLDRLGKAKSLPATHVINNIIKYESSLERSIFRNLATLKALQESRSKAQDSEDEVSISNG